MHISFFSNSTCGHLFSASGCLNIRVAERTPLPHVTLQTDHCPQLLTAHPELKASESAVKK